jgi:uncharacterized repeat protein (TIGR01451 family)
MKLLRLAVIFLAALGAITLIRSIAVAAPTYTITQKWQRCYPGNWCETGWYASPAVSDVDKDGTPEVLGGGYTLLSINGSSGAIEWSGTNTGRLWPGIVVADLDQNGSLEVVTGNGNGYIDVYNAAGTPVGGWHIQPTGTSNELRSLAVANLDTNSDLEIAVCSTRSDNQWFVYEHNGSLRSGWPKQTDSDTNGYAAGCFNENVGLADIDNDGRGELIGPNDTHYATAFNDNGTPVYSNPIYDPITGRNNPWARVGLHVDHAVDLRGYAHCGTEHRPNMANSAPTIADVNGDGTLEIIIVGNVHNCGTSPYTDLYEMPFILNADRTRWKDAINDWTVIPLPDAHAAPLSENYSVIENSVPNPVVADLDGDGRQEILYPSYDGRLHAYWLDKTEHGSWPFEVTNPAEGFIRFASEPIVVDLENDGKAEVIVASWTQHGSYQPGKLYILRWDGSLIQALDLPWNPNDTNWRGGGSLTAPTMANIDLDPDLEIVVSTVNKGLVAYDVANSARARILWGTGRGNYRRTGQPRAPYYVNGFLDNSYRAVNDARPQPGAAITYTIVLTNPGPALTTVRLTDTLSSNAAFVNGSLSASSGTWGFRGGVITWTGSVAAGVTLTYVMTTSTEITPLTLIFNTALINDGAGNILTRSAGAIVDGYATYLPVVRK